MGVPQQKPRGIVKILLLGAPGVGKKCLESRFITSSYPPPYDPALTVSSRREIMLDLNAAYNEARITSTSPYDSMVQPQDAGLAKVRLEDTSPYGLSESLVEKLELDATIMKSAPNPGKPPATNQSHNLTEYTIETINYPSLQSPQERMRVLSKESIDAVIIMYDVTRRSSIDVAKHIYAEVQQRFGHTAKKRRDRLSRPLKVSHRTPIVAFVGSKCDVDSITREPVSLGAAKSSVARLENLNQASRASRTSTESSQSIVIEETWRKIANEPAKHDSPNTILDLWMRIDQCTPSVTPKPLIKSAESRYSASYTKAPRQISKIEGQHLSMELGADIPFFETSAKTGENVEVLFETILRAVLASRARQEVPAPTRGTTGCMVLPSCIRSRVFWSRLCGKQLKSEA
ncbi:hypothetical protein HOO65_110046 [Ceratocystis lukuohia]|uniref:Ras family protein n=1 Tax=Ceratocystis lukuohia TaxID=2019550 RepID=A0ABR4M8H3_9PEZI